MRVAIPLVVACAALGACAPVTFSPFLLGAPRAGTALWVWNTPQLLEVESHQRQLLDFARDHGISTLWVQITTSRPRAAQHTPPEVTNASAWREFLTRAHAAGMIVSALDGDPTYALATRHAIPLGIAEAVVAFNRSAPPPARFDGIHFDIEPYLLPQWQERRGRERLLGEYLALVAEVRRRTLEQGLVYTVDVPFWWHLVDDATGDTHAAVTFQGKRQSATLHLLEHVDGVTLMNYRNEADGPDGLVANAMDLLAAADRMGRGFVRIGVETAPMLPEQIWFVLGPQDTDLPGLIEGEIGILTEPRRVRVFNDGTRVHLGVPVSTGAASEGMSGGAPPPQLVALARRFGVAESSPRVLEAEGRAVARMDGDAEWGDVRVRPIPDPERRRTYRGISATYTPSRKTTFATRPPGDMAKELGDADAVFRTFASYRGLAIHDYEAYRALGGRVPPRASGAARVTGLLR